MTATQGNLAGLSRFIFKAPKLARERRLLPSCSPQ